MRETFDVVIVGGAVVGAATAYFTTALLGPTARVLVLERDPSYASSATGRSAASIRHQFSTAINVRLSMFGTAFLRQAPELLRHDGEAPAIGFHEGGYLYLASPAGRDGLAANHALQRAEGADIAWFERDALAARFPWLATADLAAGTLGLAGEGWLDAHALMHGLRRKAVAQGAVVRTGAVAAIESASGRASGVRLADGSRIEAGHVVLAAGTGARALAATAGIELPVHAKKRCVFHVTSPEPAPGCPLVIDTSGLWFRPEGQGFIAGLAPGPDEDPDSDDFEVPPHWFDERVWPLLAARVPGFEALRVRSSWAGHYDMNAFDANAIVGPHPALANLLFANGFSGHGLQQAPGVGRGLAEWIAHGAFRSLDLAPLGWQRVIDRRPLRELNVV